LARETKLPTEDVEAALAVLGSRGLAGYDAGRAAYFHRQLPFDLDKVEQFQPRLKAARKLLESNGVTLLEHDTEGELDVEVAGSGVTHLVRLRPAGDKCSCLGSASIKGNADRANTFWPRECSWSRMTRSSNTILGTA